MSGTAPIKIELKVHELGETTVNSTNDSCYRSVTQPKYDSVPDYVSVPDYDSVPDNDSVG